jgi:hypothetical protein
MIDATNWTLPSTKRSKYAHAPEWTVGRHKHGIRAACGQSLPSVSQFDLMFQDAARGKPPCPRCVKAIRHHLDFVAGFLASYENLTWEEPT